MIWTDMGGDGNGSCIALHMTLCDCMSLTMILCVLVDEFGSCSWDFGNFDIININMPVVSLK